MGAFNQAESTTKPSPYLVFEDVYDRKTAHLNEQRRQLEQHLEKYGDNYNLEEYDK